MKTIKKLIIATALIGSLSMQDIKLYAMNSDTEDEGSEENASAAQEALPTPRFTTERIALVRPFLSPPGISELVSLYAQPTEEDAKDATKNILDASRAGDMGACMQALENGADVNCAHLAGTPLSRAIFNNNTQIAHLLLSHNADPNQSSGRKYTSPLEYAIRRNNAKAVELLLDHKADPNQETGRFDLRPLCLAIEDVTTKGHSLETIQRLIFAGADPLLTNENDDRSYMDMATPEIKAAIEQAQAAARRRAQEHAAAAQEGAVTEPSSETAQDARTQTYSISSARTEQMPEQVAHVDAAEQPSERERMIAARLKKFDPKK
ncbi:MAG: ankyrin repeat domain-containing protein [Candidatus Dependentiae bacterium]|nr:ankyrin repeat domain-containing protein [Candidatus Dependentiae bacterium]